MDAHGLALGIKLRDEFEILPKVETMDRFAYVLDNGKISYGMLQAQNAKICPGFDQVYEKIEKSIPKSRYLGYDANLQRFSTDITRYINTQKYSRLICLLLTCQRFGDFFFIWAGLAVFFSSDKI